jgi:hypothetical protein
MPHPQVRAHGPASRRASPASDTRATATGSSTPCAASQDEWLERMGDHIPTPASAGHSSIATTLAGCAESALKRSWARLIEKVYNVDPLTCRKCGGKLRIVAYFHDQGAVRKIFDRRDPFARRAGRGRPRTARSPRPQPARDGAAAARGALRAGGRW